MTWWQHILMIAALPALLVPLGATVDLCACDHAKAVASESCCGGPADSMDSSVPSCCQEEEQLPPDDCGCDGCPSLEVASIALAAPSATGITLPSIELTSTRSIVEISPHFCRPAAFHRNRVETRPPSCAPVPLRI